MGKLFKVIKDIPEGWEVGAQIGDILTVSYWGGVACGELTLMNKGKAVCDLDSDYANECCEEVQ